jgi:hypothetical protein
MSQDYRQRPSCFLGASSQNIPTSSRNLPLPSFLDAADGATPKWPVLQWQ